MSERFELQMNAQGQADIIDWFESKEKGAICIYNDLGVIPFSSAKALCELLNSLHEEKESWKADAVNGINLHSMLSFEVQKLTETKDVEAFLDFYYKYFCKM